MPFIEDLIADPVTLVCAIIAAVVLAVRVHFSCAQPPPPWPRAEKPAPQSCPHPADLHGHHGPGIRYHDDLDGALFMDLITRERSKDLKLIVRRSAARSQHAAALARRLPRSVRPPILAGIARMYGPNDFHDLVVLRRVDGPQEADAREPGVLLHMDPDKVIPMMDDLQDFDPALIEKMKAQREAVLIGSEKLRSIGQEDAFRKNGSARVKLISINYRTSTWRSRSSVSCPTVVTTKVPFCGKTISTRGRPLQDHAQRPRPRHGEQGG